MNTNCCRSGRKNDGNREFLETYHRRSYLVICHAQTILLLTNIPHSDKNSSKSFLGLALETSRLGFSAERSGDIEHGWPKRRGRNGPGQSKRVLSYCDHAPPAWKRFGERLLGLPFQRNTFEKDTRIGEKLLFVGFGAIYSNLAERTSSACVGQEPGIAFPIDPSKAIAPKRTR